MFPLLPRSHQQSTPEENTRGCALHRFKQTNKQQNKQKKKPNKKLTLWNYNLIPDKHGQFHFDMSSVDIYIWFYHQDFFSSQRRQQGISRAQEITPILDSLMLPVRCRQDGFVGRYSHNRQPKFDEIKFNLGDYFKPQNKQL